ncbi:MAG: hypothetical protein ACHREM_09330 [Polyangiales bacterium]
MTHLRYRRLVSVSALYDLVVTLPFATPFTARATLDLVATLHARLGLPGEAPPAFATTHVFFATLFGTVVVLWSIFRLRHPRPEVGLFDGIGRVVFVAWMAWALASGASRLLFAFVVPEACFGAAQLIGYATLMASAVSSERRAMPASSVHAHR